MNILKGFLKYFRFLFIVLIKDQRGPLGEMPRFEEKDADFELAWKLQREEQVSL